MSSTATNSTDLGNTVPGSAVPGSAVVAGAGPVGLTVAAELRLRGIEVIVLEPLPSIDPRVKAGSLAPRAVDALDLRGLAERIPSFALPQTGGQRVRTGGQRGSGPRGHFAGMWVLRESAYSSKAATLVPQQVLEELLDDHAAAQGADIRRGHTLTGYTQDEEGVTVQVEGPEGPYELRAGWLVGADGGRSTVRKLSGVPFPGTDGVITGYQALAELDDPDFAPMGWNRLPGGLVVNGPVPGRVLVVEFEGPPADRDAAITVEEFQSTLRRVSGSEVTVLEARSLTRFTDNARLAESFVIGRVVLAGDAAHVHSPFGGQGLNLGLGDAFNLGWKLAAVIKGEAGRELLDTYTAERGPVAAGVLKNTRAQVAMMRPGPYADAVRELFAMLLEADDANRRLTDLISGAGLRYDLGSAHDLVGRFVPDLTVKTAEGSFRVAELMRSGRGLLLVLDGRAVPEEWAGRVETVRGACEAAPADALLVRPDGHVAWAAGDGSLTEALTTWFGPA
ncbi:FAD-dependent monooxygenase [Nonomuraea sp. bgisy101]|uniref:FAD-dependent monooxygenase n=1 Tax=Nonomuraea sp. bgisy101 TaxID=3413784 RepID=UPI003D738BD5